ncbi:MAG: hypothetical protein ABFS14_03895 [Gemmatimonadota bacterium]
MKRMLVRSRLLFASTAAAYLGLAAVGPVSAQMTPQELGEPVAAYDQPFSTLSGVRELSDGRVVVSDGLEEAVQILDAGLSSATQVGRKGQGPGEHGQPDALYPWGQGDETLLVDLGNARLTVIAPDGEMGESMPMSREANGAPMIVIPGGVDKATNVYFQPLGISPGGGIPDSSTVVRLAADGSQLDTIAAVKRPDMRSNTSGSSNNRSTRITRVPLSAQDSWAVGADGSVAIARSADYHLEWIKADGSIRRGSPVDYDPVRVRGPEKDRWIAGRQNGLNVGMTIDNGQRRMSFSRGGGGTPEADPDDYEWPETMPPFAGGGAVSVTPDGNAWVERNTPAGDPVMFDVFGPSGDRIGIVVLPEGRRLVTFGAGSVYLSRQDDLDFVWLEKYDRTL